MTTDVLVLCTHNSARSVLADGLRSKCWDEFTGPGGPPLKVHWGYPDPSNAEGGAEGRRRAS